MSIEQLRRDEIINFIGFHLGEMCAVFETVHVLYTE